MPQFFENLTDLRERADDVSHFPHRQLASKVFGMTHELFMRGEENPVHLRPDISPEMLEACVARIFGKKIHEKLVATLPAMKEAYAECDGDDIWLEAHRTRPLLGDIAEKSAWGSPATEDPDALAHLLLMVMGPWGDKVDRFVAQATKRLAMH